MLIIGLFTRYFLILMVVQGLIVAFIDASTFRKNNLKHTARLARVLGISSIVLGVGLFFLRMLT